MLSNKVLLTQHVPVMLLVAALSSISNESNLRSMGLGTGSIAMLSFWQLLKVSRIPDRHGGRSLGKTPPTRSGNGILAVLTATWPFGKLHLKWQILRKERPLLLVNDFEEEMQKQTNNTRKY